MINDTPQYQLRHKIGQIIGMAIPQGGYSEKIKQVDLAGRFTPKEMKNCLVAILEYLDKEEDGGANTTTGEPASIPVQP